MESRTTALPHQPIALSRRRAYGAIAQAPLAIQSVSCRALPSFRSTAIPYAVAPGRAPDASMHTY
jgi:hypothetical protein